VTIPPTLNPPNAPHFRDHLETKASAWIQPWNSEANPDAILVGAPLSKTSISLSGASQTPQAIRELFGVLTTYNIDHDIDLADKLTLHDAGNAKIHATDLALSRLAIYNAVETVCSAAPKSLPIILGGDHSITAPAFEAFRAHIDGPVGIIQLDAHMDLRNLEDGGLTNGTPIRQLIESGTVRGKHVVQIGLHAFANAKPYADFAREHGITQYTARQVAREGIEPLIARALDIATSGTKAVYVTVDMDVLDQAYAPGVPAQIPGGMTTWQLFDAVLALGKHPAVKAFDIVEVDPTQDLRRATVRAAAHTVMTFLTGVALRQS
jgi:formiminoglutamase